MDEIEDGVQLVAVIKARTTLLFSPDHGATGDLKRSHLSIKVLICGRGACVADTGVGCVHFGCA